MASNAAVVERQPQDVRARQRHLGPVDGLLRQLHDPCGDVDARRRARPAPEREEQLVAAHRLLPQVGLEHGPGGERRQPAVEQREVRAALGRGDERDRGRAARARARPPCPMSPHASGPNPTGSPDHDARARGSHRRRSALRGRRPRLPMPSPQPATPARVRSRSSVTSRCAPGKHPTIGQTKVVHSIKLPGLDASERLRVRGEVEITTCEESSKPKWKCGTTGLVPHVEARLILANGANDTSGDPARRGQGRLPAPPLPADPLGRRDGRGDPAPT